MKDLMHHGTLTFLEKKRRTFASLVEFQGTLTFSAREKNIKTSPGFW
jgi:hypothetical protein